MYKNKAENSFSVVGLSRGKNATFMLLRMIELGMPIDAVLYADTGMEFPEMYEHLNKLDDRLFRERGLHITVLRHQQGFEYLLLEQPQTRPNCVVNRNRLGVPLIGHGWPWSGARWCTRQLITYLLKNEVDRLKEEKQAVHFVGIAPSEMWRCKEARYPLDEWGVTDAEALRGCYDRGFTFGGLYDIYSRCSCWCCPFQRIEDLRNMRCFHPDLWKKLMEIDRRVIAQFGNTTFGTFKSNWTVEKLDQCFANEEREQ